MAQYEEKIKDLLEKMTLEEKVGQLQQCGPSLVGAFEVSFSELLDMMFDGKISEAEFGRLMSTAQEDFHEEDLRAGKIGSYNGIKNAATANKLQKIAVEETRLGIPLVFGYDVIHGYRTIMPIPLAEACAWDPALWEKTARVAAKEATAAGIHMTFAPMVDVAKDARWGRVSEGAGEDAYLSSLFGMAKVKGFQSEDLSKEDAMVACVKHFAGYGAAEAGRDYNRVDMSMQRFYEEYLPPYEACIKAGARAIMPAFNDINGVPCSVNKWLLTNILREKWRFDGMTVSDANAIAECVNHGIAEDKSDASRQAIEAGMDMDMSSNSYSESLVQLVQNGVVKEEVLDRAVADVLRIKCELGLFEHPYQTSEEREKEELLKPEYRTLARETAGKSMVLLKNEGVLPLKNGTRVGVVGGLADNRGEMTGAWAIGANPEECISIVDACNVQGIDYIYTKNLEEIENCDVVVVSLGETKDQSGEAASRSDITIPEEQMELLDELVKSGKPVITVLFNGRPLALGAVAEKADAILEAWYPGIEAGNAILDILFGRVNPSAKLTTTFPYASGQCPMYYSHINTGRPGGKGKFTSKYLDTPLEPVYPFGYGLSYTTYNYQDLEVVESREAFIASATITNIGEVAGEEIVQCYIRDLVAQRVRPVKQLKAFEKIKLDPGESKKISFTIPYQELGYYNNEMEYIVEEGTFEIFIGKNSEDYLSQKIVLYR
jgi:beta-glucosidase-like glycosyl hydrolase